MSLSYEESTLRRSKPSKLVSVQTYYDFEDEEEENTKIVEIFEEVKNKQQIKEVWSPVVQPPQRSGNKVLHQSGIFPSDLELKVKELEELVKKLQERILKLENGQHIIPNQEVVVIQKQQQPKKKKNKKKYKRKDYTIMGIKEEDFPIEDNKLDDIQIPSPTIVNKKEILPIVEPVKEHTFIERPDGIPISAWKRVLKNNSLQGKEKCIRQVYLGKLRTYLRKLKEKGKFVNPKQAYEIRQFLYEGPIKQLHDNLYDFQITWDVKIEKEGGEDASVYHKVIQNKQNFQERALTRKVNSYVKNSNSQ